jgi:hypothetical protein
MSAQFLNQSLNCTVSINAAVTLLERAPGMPDGAYIFKPKISTWVHFVGP